jgi:hypothetical protein
MVADEPTVVDHYAEEDQPQADAKAERQGDDRSWIHVARTLALTAANKWRFFHCALPVRVAAHLAQLVDEVGQSLLGIGS